MDIQSSTSIWKWQVACFFLLCSWGRVFGQLRYAILEELEPGAFIGNLAQDLGIKLSDISKRKLYLEPENNSRYFTVNQGSGVLTVKSRIDRESLCGSSPICVLHLEAVTQIPVELFNIEIEILDINDNSPAFSNTDRILRITELVTIPGVRFPLETAQDADVGNNGISQYRLSSSPYFSLSVKNRKDRSLFPELVLEKNLDREDIKEHKLYLTAWDGGEIPRSGSLQITILVVDINDNAPVFDQPIYKVCILENIHFTFVLLTLNATDIDEGTNADIEYFFDEHVSASANDLFNINHHTGEIFIKGIIDYEESNYWELPIRAVDKGIPELEGRCLVQVEVQDINDNPPEILFTSVTNEVPENAAVGTVVGFLVVRDNDSDKNEEVQLDISPNIPFEIRHLSNRYSLVTNGLLDRETIPKYEITITAADLGSPSLSTKTKVTLNISDINDNTPIFLQSVYNAFIKENNDPGSLLCTIAAFDIDEGVNSKLTYSIVDSQIGGTAISSLVYMNTETGNLYSQHSFDFEQIQVLQITVKVEDSGSQRLHSTTSVFIFILDANDNYPTVLYPEDAQKLYSQHKLPKSAKAGFLVTKISAMDLDSGHNAWLQFRLADSTNSKLFQVSEYTGEIRTVRELEELDHSEQTVTISIHDHGEPSLSTTVTMLINIVDDMVLENPKSSDFLANSKPTDNMTLYLIISLVAISLVSLVTFIILTWKCLKQDHIGNTCGSCFPNKSHSKHYIDQYQPTLFMNSEVH